MNLRKMLVAAFVTTSILSLGMAASPPKPEPVEVLVLGTYHFGNPGRDLHNIQVDDVRIPAKQAELADVAARLAKFKPTKIAVEAISDRADLAYAKYEAFVPEMLTKNSDERVQIGFRLAKNLGHKIVYGIDEQSETIDYFPYGKVEAFAKEHGEGPSLAMLNEQVQNTMKEMEVAQKTTPINLMLARMNDPARLTADNREFYYALLRMGDNTTQPGAELNGGWYLRNAKIFAKLSQITRPGDRVVVLFGAGHAYWLRHFAQSTPGFTLVEATKFLR